MKSGNPWFSSAFASLALLLNLAGASHAWSQSLVNRDSSCLEIDWNDSEDSDGWAIQERTVEEFARLNGDSVLFNTVEDSIVRSVNQPERPIHSISRGCFGIERLRIGTNEVRLQWFRRGYVSRGTSLTIFKLLTGRGNPRELCRDTGLNGGSCSVAFKLSLAEISPDAADRIRDLKRQMQRLERRLSEARAENADLDEVRRKLDELFEKDLEKLTEEELAAISEAVGELWELVRGLQGDLEELRREYAEKMAQQQAEVARMREQALAELDRQGIDVRDESLYGKYLVEVPEIPTPDLAAIAGDETAFDPEHNIYRSLESGFLDGIDRAIREDDLVALQVLGAEWSRRSAMLLRELSARHDSASTAEMKVLTEVVQRVNAKFYSVIDAYGFKRGSPAPQDLRRGIQDEIAPVEPGRAAALRDAINSWKNEQPTPQQELVLETSEGLVAGYAALRKLPAQESQSILPKLNRVLDATIEAAKLAARIGVSFTPANDFVDFCEIVTGREFCVPGAKELSTEDRAFAAMGLVVGSRQFWGEVGKVVDASPLWARRAERFKAATSRAAEYIRQIPTGIQILIEKAMEKLTGRSRAAREYVIRLSASGQGWTPEDLARIELRFLDLERRFKTVSDSPESGTTLTVWRGKKLEYVDEAADEVEEVFKWDKYSRASNYRFSLGGAFGQDALYGSIGPESRARQTVVREMRSPSDPVVVAKVDIRPRRILDLRDPLVLKHLGVRESELLGIHEALGAPAYEVTQQIGRLASRFGFDAIIAKSAMAADIGGVNVVILKQWD